MSMPDLMTKIRIVAPKSLSYTVISTLYDLNVFHVHRYEQNNQGHAHGLSAHDHTADDLRLDIGAPLEQAEQNSRALLQVRAIKTILGISELKNHASPHKDMMYRISALHDKLQDIHSKRNKAEQQLAHQQSLLSTVRALEKLGVEYSISGLRYVTAFVGTLKNLAVEHALKVQGIQSEFASTPLGQDHLAVIIVQRGHESKARALLHDAGFAPLSLDQYKNLNSQELEHAAERDEKMLKELDTRLTSIRDEQKQHILDYEVLLQEEIKKAELPLQFATTARSFIATGYVPKKLFVEIKNALEHAAKHSIHIEEQHIDHHDDVPVKLHNSPQKKNFEILTRLYELPSYFELDPTSLLFITFPIFYGIMLGDVIYGLILFFLFFFLKRKIPDAKAWFNVLMYAALMSIVFGVVFGEYLGFEHVSVETGQSLCQNVGVCLHKEIIEAHGESEIVYSFPRLINRAHDTVNVFGIELLSVLAFSVIVGALHLNFGLLLGFWNVYHAHGLRLAMLEKASWFVMQIGLAIIVLSKMSLIIIPWWIGLIIFFVSGVMLFLGEGAKGIVEIPGLFSNMLSYMRLGALGLASVVLAVVINDGLALPLMEKGGIFIVIAILIMIVGHAINIGLGVIGPFLHGIRLHYVEFYSKFFHGGGSEYTPFGKKAQMEGE
ncbi:MAG TPA: V-type ATP synthase subunit I [Candidatus Nanoarchaeia archaeon]|nr:V-type ATP synthase subunit I [Candidatus Nanoarchaeia archaeon]